jgi:hypothetical protein
VRGLIATALLSLSAFAFAAPARPPLVFLDAPLADIADEGLPCRFTVAFPATLDPIARALRATEAR